MALAIHPLKAHLPETIAIGGSCPICEPETTPRAPDLVAFGTIGIHCCLTAELFDCRVLQQETSSTSAVAPRPVVTHCLCAALLI
jgi:hypothetical protein